MNKYWKRFLQGIVPLGGWVLAAGNMHLDLPVEIGLSLVVGWFIGAAITITNRLSRTMNVTITPENLQ